jgi:signal transduction histidine kinase
VEGRLADAAVARLIGIVYSQTSVREVLGAALGAILELLDANDAALAVKEEATQRAFLWQAKLRPGAPKGTIIWEELEKFQHRKYFFSLPGSSCYAARPSTPATGMFDVIALDENGRRLRPNPYAFPEYFIDWHPFRSILVISFSVGGEKQWVGRLFIFDPGARRDHEAELRLLSDLVRETAPAVHAVYRLRRLRSRASGMERARIALELHDGVIQTLASLEMRVEALRRNRSGADRALLDELTNIQHQLRLESFKLRGVIHQLRSFEPDSGTLLESAAELVNEFQRETGISAAVIAESNDIALPQGMTHEVLRIVAEALTNIRKHSRAQKAVVHFGLTHGLFRLLIEDDGQGFGFSGRLSHAELEATRRSPRVISERVRSLGGELVVVSAPGRGARLEITFPKKQRIEA